MITLQRNAESKLMVKATNGTFVMTDRTELKGTIVAEKGEVTLTKTAELKLEGDVNFAIFSLKDNAMLDAKS